MKNLFPILAFGGIACLLLFGFLALLMSTSHKPKIARFWSAVIIVCTALSMLLGHFLHICLR